METYSILYFVLERYFNTICASGSVGGARPCQGRGRGFESRLALLFFEACKIKLLFLFRRSFLPFSKAKRIFLHFHAPLKVMKKVKIFFTCYFIYFRFPDIVCSTILFIVSSFNCPLAYPNTSPSLVIINVVGNAFTP